MPNIFRHRGRAVLYILHSGNLYGTERMALATLGGLTEYDARVVVAPKPTGTASVAEAAGKAGHATASFHTHTQLLRAVLPWFLRYRRIDVIGVGVGSSLMCHWLGRVLGVRLRQLQVAHGGTADWHAYGRKHQLNGIPVGMVAVSNFVRDKLIAHDVPANRISVIENFLSDEERSAAAKRLPYEARSGQAARLVDRSQVKVIIVSRIDAIKRLDVLIGTVRAHGLHEFQFDVYGTGTDLESSRAASTDLPNLRFHGFADDIPARLQRADLLLHLCPDEPFGLVVLEAFVAGVAVLVPDQGGAGSLVDDGVTGFTFRANDPDDLARSLVKVGQAEPALLQSLVHNASALLDDRFAQSAGVQRYREALEASDHAPAGPKNR